MAALAASPPLFPVPIRRRYTSISEFCSGGFKSNAAFAGAGTLVPIDQ